MAWHYGTFACGHEGRVNIVGPHKNREYLANRKFARDCDDCYAQRIERERQEEKQRSQELELPPLMGSEKQVAWANSLRLKMIEHFEQEKNEHAPIVLDFILRTRTRAKYYIEVVRGESIDQLIAIEYDNAINAPEKEARAAVEQQQREQEKAAATVYPEDPCTSDIATVTVGKDEISVVAAKNDDFRELVRGLGYKWSDGAWMRKISYMAGPIEDRAAELGNALLNDGFPVCIFDEDIRQKAVSGDYDPEHTRWIVVRTSGDFEGRFAIWWNRPDDLFTAAKQITGARWSSPSMVVPTENYEEVLDFAEMYDFRLTPKAEQAVEDARRRRQDAITVAPAPEKEVTALESQDDVPALSIPEGVTIDESLRDDN